MALGGRSRILVIDDDPTVRILISDVLTFLGYETDAADSGVQGLALLERRPYDLVITDLRMPQMTGWDVVNAVRGRLPTMPMIMISGFATGDDVRHADRSGVPLLQKPFSVAELRRVVREVLTAAASQSERRTESELLRKPPTKAPAERQRDPEALQDQS